MTSTWTVLTKHLQDPVRARIFFELMMNGSEQIDIKQIAVLTNRARNTINHHVDKMLADGILSVDKVEQKGRGKPTRSFILNPSFLKELTKGTPQISSYELFEETLRRKSSLLAMLANLCIETLTEEMKPKITSKGIMENDREFPLYLYSAHSLEELKVFQKHLVPAIQAAKAEVESLNLQPINPERFVIFTGYVPVISRDS